MFQKNYEREEDCPKLLALEPLATCFIESIMRDYRDMLLTLLLILLKAHKAYFTQLNK